MRQNIDTGHGVIGVGIGSHRRALRAFVRAVRHADGFRIVGFPAVFGAAALALQALLGAL